MKTLVLRGLTCSLTLLLAACGGGGQATSPDTNAPSIRQFTSDGTSYFVGERAHLTAVYANGTGRIQPGDIPVSSGQTITTPPLTANTTFRLIIAGRSTTATREIAVAVSYRERVRPIPVPFARTEHAAVILIDGRLLIVGGLLATTSNGNAIGVSTTLDPTAETYDPATGAFTLLPASLSEARHRHTAVATTDGRVLIYGGLTDSRRPAPPELYDPATDTFAVLAAPENSVRANHAAVRTLDGSIWIVGGDDDSSAAALASVIRFDATSETSRHALNLATPRRLLGAAPLPDSRMLISGGTTDLMLGHVTESSELIVGGSDQSGIPLASAELYE